MYKHYKMKFDWFMLLFDSDINCQTSVGKRLCFVSDTTALISILYFSDGAKINTHTQNRNAIQ